MTQWILTAVGIALTLSGDVDEVAGQNVRRPGSKVQRKTRRVAAPDWKQTPGAEIFFADPFGEGLVGTRPTKLSSDVEENNRTHSPTPGAETRDETTTAWSGVISATTLEDEIKRIEGEVRAAVQSEGKFRGGGFQTVRQRLGIGAFLFAIIDQYDRDVRWKQAAMPTAVSLAKTANNSKVGTRASFRDARIRQQELFDLIRGSSTNEETSETTLAEVTDRTLLMQHLEMSLKDSLPSLASTSQSLERQRDRALREAELVAAIAVGLLDAEMDDALDEEYQAFCESMLSAAQRLKSAVESVDSDVAKAGLRDLQRSCDACHDIYR